MERLRNGGRSWPSIHPCLTWIYSGTVSIICTAGGLVAVICGYEGWKPDFVNIGQKNFVRFSFFLGLILIMFVMVWNLSAILFIKISHQLDDLLRSRQEPHESPQSHFRSYKQPKRRIFSQLSGLLMVGMLLICILLELAGTGYVWYVFVQVSRVHERQLHNTIVNFCDAKYEEVVCQEAYQQFKGWFHMFRIMLPLLAVLQLPAFLVNCFAWVLVDLEGGHPLSPVHKPDNASVSFSFSQPHDPINYYGNLTLPERPQPIGQELTPKLATAGTRALSHKPVCVPCPKAPLGLQVPGHCSAEKKLENKLFSPGLGSQVSNAVTGSPLGIIYQELSPCPKNSTQRLRSFRTQHEAAHETCDAASSQIDMLEDRLGDGGTQKTRCLTHENPSPSRPRRWTTNQLAFSSTDPELLQKVAQDKNMPVFPDLNLCVPLKIFSTIL